MATWLHDVAHSMLLIIILYRYRIASIRKKAFAVAPKQRPLVSHRLSRHL